MGERLFRGRLPLRVLLADDSESLRFLMRVTLEGHPAFHVVGAAADGVQAVEIAAETQPDLVLLDIAMPRMDGLEATPQIRARCPDVKIVILSGYSESRMAAAALAAGADAFLEKALPDDAVLATLLDVCGRAHAGGVPAPREPASSANAPPPPLDSTSVDLLLDALEEGVVVTDAAGVVTAANFSAGQILGLPTSRLVGTPIGELGLRDEVAGEPVSAALASGRPLSAVDLVVVRADGTTVHVLASVRPVQHPGATAPHGAVASFIDITARHRAETAAGEALTRFRVALDTMLDAVNLFSAVRDESGAIVDFLVDHANPATLHIIGHPAQELIGRRLLELFPEMRGTALLASYVRVVETGEPLVIDGMDYRSSSSAGDLAPGAYTVRASRIGDGFVATWRLVGRRATDRPRPLAMPFAAN